MSEESSADKLGYKLAELNNENGYSLLDEDILKKLNDKCDRIILITGTNGKTTTNNMLNHILKSHYKTITNVNGTDTIEGLIAPLLIDIDEKYDFGLFEVDANSMPKISEYITPDYLIITNFFRDQLDTFGEVESAIELVHESIKEPTKVILNADDPSTYYFNDLKNEKIYFHLENIESIKENFNLGEFLFCPKCGSKLDYDYINYGNIGGYSCPNCEVTNPQAKYNITDAKSLEKGYSFEVNEKYSNRIDIIGNYNLYNALAAIATSFEIGISPETIADRIESYIYKQGRTEFMKIKGKQVSLALTKNPIAASEQLIGLKDNGAEKSILFILNDEQTDSEDVSWIWDIDLKSLNSIENMNKFYCLGSRKDDLAIRLKYSDLDLKNMEICIEDNLEKVIDEAINENDEIYIIGTPSGISESKEIIKGGI